ncbi:MAG: LamG domain-containing protein, partial [Planctomycetota bacterium]
MRRRLFFLTAIALVLGVVNSVWAAAYTWTNGGTGDSWCTADNWSPAGGPPGVAEPNDTATIAGTIDDGPRINCDVNIGDVTGPNPGASNKVVVDIESSGSIIVNSDWEWSGGDGEATFNIAGDLTILGGWFRAPDGGTGYVNILPGANVWISGELRGADETGSFYEVDMSGGDVNVGAFKLGDNGSGNFYLTGGRFHSRGSFEIRGRGGAWFDVLIDGGAELIVDGAYLAPSEVEAGAHINLDNGYIECGDWLAAGENWILDINEGMLRIRNAPAGTEARIQGWIDAGQITGYNGTVTPQVTTDGADVVVTVAFVHLKAWSPDPENGTTNVCPDPLTLSWTPGVYADTHDIYFGDSMDDVNENATAVETAYSANSWNPPSPFELGKTYYWRVDEVNDACDPAGWTGGIWQFATTNGKAFDPFPVNGYRGIAASKVTALEWTPSCVADGHRVYYGTDLPASIVLFEDGFESGSFDANWTTAGAEWTVYDANTEPNHRHGGRYSASATSGSEKILTSADADAAEAGAINVSVWLRMERMTGGTVELEYYDGSSWDLVADWNSVDPCDTWLHFSETVTDSQYLISDFKIRLKANITGTGTAVYVDDVTINNTWPLAAKWYQGQQAETSYPVSVQPFKSYYWRIDEVIDGNVVQGDHWSFRTGLGGVLMYYRFDSTLGSDLPSPITDTTGNVTFTKHIDPCDPGTVKYGESNPVVQAESGTSAQFNPNACLYRSDPCEPSEVDFLRLDGYHYTIEMWVKPDRLEDSMDDITLIGKSGGPWRLQINDPGTDNEFRQTHADNDETVPDTAVEGEWHHLAAVFNRLSADPDNHMLLYLNGNVINTNDEDGLNPQDNNEPVGLGGEANADGTFGGFFEGKIDEVRIMDVALSPGQFLLTPGPEWASNPSPYNGQAGVDPNDPTVALSWTPGTEAASHKVYFSTNYDDVANGSAPAYVGEFALDSNEVNDLDLTFGRTYYWRVDEVNGSETWEGVIWRFTTKFQIINPNLRVWYKFDESDTSTVIDYSGYELHGAGDPLPLENWEPAGGRFDGSLKFDDDASVEVPRELFDNISDEITVSVWLNGLTTQDPSKDMTVLHVGVDGAPAELRILVPDDTGNVYWRAGNDSNDALAWEVDTSTWREDWHHLAFVKDESADRMYIYLDGDVGWRKPGGTKASLTTLRRMPVRLGAYTDNESDYEGKMDDFRVYDYALTETEIEQLFRGGDLASAWGPSPYDGQADAPRDSDLVWNAGDFAGSHDVYFGTDYDAVSDANTAVTLGVFKGNQSETTYDLATLDLDQTYYWRIDEVNDSNGFKWTGKVWKFRVADYIIVDDFEFYDTDADLRFTWVDATRQLIRTGARLFLANFSTLYPAHGGNKIMRYGYYTDWPVWADTVYAEASLPLSGSEKNWTDSGVRALTLFFYGLPSNAATDKEQMYIGVEDSTGTYAEIRYGDYRTGEDISDINEPEWHEWFIALPDFNDPCYAAVAANVDFTDVNIFYIGFGNRRNPQVGGYGEVRFDDIRLNLPTCRPELAKPVGDFTGGRGGQPDCIVDIADIGYIAENEWLKTDANFAGQVQEPAGDANLIGHWALDGDATDSSIYDHNSTLQGTAYSWVVGHDDVNPALEFTGGGTRVLVDDSNDLKPKYAVTASAWVYYTESQSSSRVVVKGADDAETYELELDGLNNFIFLLRDANGNKFEVGENESYVWPNEWIHIAGTFDGDANTLKSYVNGELKGSRADANFVKLGKTLSQDTAGLAIGNRSDDTDRQFTGAVDEVRVYDYALSEAQIKWLATDGTGYIPLRSEANLYDLEPQGEKAVNFRDIGVLIS